MMEGARIQGRSGVREAEQAQSAIIKTFRDRSLAEATAGTLKRFFPDSKIKLIGGGIPPKHRSTAFSRLSRAGVYVLILYCSVQESLLAASLLGF